MSLHEEIAKLISEKANLNGIKKRKPMLISDENISITSSGLWEGNGPSPEAVASRLMSLCTYLVERNINDFKVVIGIRRQDAWLASRYAESEKLYPYFSSEDFQFRMDQIASESSLPSVFLWLDYSHVQRVFSETFGANNVFLLPIERIEEDAATSIMEVGRFVSGENWSNLIIKLRERGALDVRRNMLATAPNSWKMRNSGRTLTLSLETRKKLLSRFLGSNEKFSESSGFKGYVDNEII